MRALTLFLCLLLSGCWFGGRFYDDVRPSVLIAPGDYVAIGPGRDQRQALRVSLRADGMTMVVGADEAQERTRPFGFVPLPGHPGVFVAWQDTTMLGVRESHPVYAIAAARPGGEYRIFSPFCSNTSEAAAAGPAETNADGSACMFASRAALERGLGMLVPRLDEGLRLVPAGREGR